MREKGEALAVFGKKTRSIPDRQQHNGRRMKLAVSQALREWGTVFAMQDTRSRIAGEEILTKGMLHNSASDGVEPPEHRGEGTVPSRGKSARSRNGKKERR